MFENKGGAKILACFLGTCNFPHKSSTICEECGKFMSSTNIKRRHMTEKHCEVNLFNCEECGKVVKQEHPTKTYD